ncbi:MAG: riboflavin synthase [Burkholderiaceae bacterium]|nr:riboflavin synthase [Burkholderiaceae bacterium]
MFTGIVQAIGRIVSVEPAQVAWAEGGFGLRLTVAFGGLDNSDMRIGDSIAMNGACMTVIAQDAESFQVDVSRESLSRTTGLDQPGPVNLEKAMRASDRFGGHMVSGHVDGTGVIKAIVQIGESHQLLVTLPAALSAYVSEKGSIALDGVSLTVNAVQDHDQGCDISINLIPHTWQSTTLNLRQPGDRLNIEVDQLAKQVERILQRIHQVQ